MNGQWIGHMWNEIWAGRWVTVDSTTNEVGSVPTLLKLKHSNSLAGTQDLRWALIDSFDLRIEDFEINDHVLVVDWSTGIERNVYSNADYGCRVAAPDNSWNLVDKSQPGQAVVRFRVPEEDNVLIHFVAFSLPPGASAKQILNARSAQFSSSYRKFKSLKRATIEVGDRSWEYFQFERAAHEMEPTKRKDEVVKATEYVWTRGPVGIIINLIAPASSHDRFEQSIRKLVSSLETSDS